MARLLRAQPTDGRPMSTTRRRIACARFLAAIGSGGGLQAGRAAGPGRTRRSEARQRPTAPAAARVEVREERAERRPNERYAGVPGGFPGVTDAGTTSYADVLRKTGYYLRVYQEVPWTVLAACAAWAAACVAAYNTGLVSNVTYEPLEKALAVTHNLLTPCLSLLLVFRVNQTYTRWWEARTAVGQLTARLVGLAEVAVTASSGQECDRMLSVIRSVPAAFLAEFCPWACPDGKEAALRSTLTHGVDCQAVLTAPNRLDAVLLLLRHASHAAVNHDVVPAGAAEALLVDIRTFICSCRRNLTTPTPMSYGAKLRLLLFVFLAALPMRLASVAGPVWAVVLSVIVCYVLLGLDAVTAALETPFGQDTEDLPIERYMAAAECRIEAVVSTAQALNNSCGKRAHTGHGEDAGVPCQAEIQHHQ